MYMEMCLRVAYPNSEIFLKLFRHIFGTAKDKWKSKRPDCSPINALEKSSFEISSTYNGTEVTETFMQNFGKAQYFKLRSAYPFPSSKKSGFISTLEVTDLGGESFQFRTFAKKGTP